MTYTQVWNPMENKISDTTILRDEDGAFIPTDPANTDYQKYRVWVSEGNRATPYTPPPAAKTVEKKK